MFISYYETSIIQHDTHNKLNLRSQTYHVQNMVHYDTELGNIENTFVFYILSRKNYSIL